MLLATLLPQLTQELASSLIAEGRNELASQLRELSYVRYRYDTSVDATYIYVRLSRKADPGDKAIVGVDHSGTVPVGHQYSVNLDIINTGRITGIEILSGGDIAAILATSAAT
jgi:uncharacterized protein YuzE